MNAQTALQALAADVEGLVGGQTVALHFSLRKRFVELHFFDRESGRRQAIGVVLAVEAHVIVLEEAAFAFGRVRNAGVLIGYLDAGNPGHLEDAPSAGLHDTVEFTQALRVVGHMLQHVVAEDDVKAVVLQGDLVQVKVHIGQRRLDVCGQDLEIGLRFETLVKTLFRSDVQHG